MVKELARLSGVTVNVIDPGTSDEPEGAKKIEALASLAAAQSGASRPHSLRAHRPPADVAHAIACFDEPRPVTVAGRRGESVLLRAVPAENRAERGPSTLFCQDGIERADISGAEGEGSITSAPKGAERIPALSDQDFQLVVNRHQNLVVPENERWPSIDQPWISEQETCSMSHRSPAGRAGASQ